MIGGTMIALKWMNRIVDRVVERFLDEVSERLA
jgi:hypothetical protein